MANYCWGTSAHCSAGCGGDFLSGGFVASTATISQLLMLSSQNHDSLNCSS